MEMDSARKDSIPTNKKIYLFSGLGADERAFQNLDFGTFYVHFIRWIPPGKNETISDYAKRIRAQITDENPILLGLSFGGMLAVEISKQISFDRLILLASAKVSAEIPPYFRLAGKIRLQVLIPTVWLKRPSRLLYWLFGTKTAWERDLLKQILADTDPIFLEWALRQIATWKNDSVPQHVFHIHGTADRILPIKFIKSDVQLDNAGHFMTLNRADELSLLIRKYLAQGSVEQ